MAEKEKKSKETKIQLDPAKIIKSDLVKVKGDGSKLDVRTTVSISKLNIR